MDSCPGELEDPTWMLGQDGRPKRLSGTGRKVFLEACTLKVSVPTDVKQVKERRFTEIDRISGLLREKMCESLACCLAAIVEAARFAGDFRILSHCRSWDPDLSKGQTSMELTVSVAMCGCFMEGPARGEWDVWPCPRRIFAKICDLELAARISREMAVQDVMSG